MNLKQIIEENEKRFDKNNSCDNTNIGRRIILTPPARKRVKLLASSFKTQRVCTVLTAGDYVHVVADTSPGRNRPAGNAYITKVSHGNINSLPFASVKMCIDNTLHHDVPLMDITIADLNELFNTTKHQASTSNSTTNNIPD